MRLPHYSLCLTLLLCIGCKPAVNHSLATITTADPQTTEESDVKSSPGKQKRAPAIGKNKLPAMPLTQPAIGTPPIPDFSKLPKQDPLQLHRPGLAQAADGKLNELPSGIPALPSGVGSPLEHRLPELPGAPHGEHSLPALPEAQGIPLGVPDVTLFKPGNIGLTGIPQGVAPIDPKLGVPAVHTSAAQNLPVPKDLPKSNSPPAPVKSPDSTQ